MVNRLLLRLMAEIFAAVDEGTPIPVADAALRPLGLPMPPYVLLQLVGPAVALHVGESLHASFGDRFPVSPSLQAIVAAKTPGRLRLDAGGQAVRVRRDPGAAHRPATGPARPSRSGTGPCGPWPRRSG